MADRTIGSRRIFEGHIIALRIDSVELASGRESTREIVEHPGAVGVLAWDGERLAMVRQWRQPAARELLEIPAGTMDPGEAPLETAKRELMEETGVEASEWQEGPAFFTAPGFCTERLQLYVATGLEQREAQGAPDEVIEVSWMTLDDAVSAIDDGSIMDAKSLVAILWLARRSGT